MQRGVARLTADELEAALRIVERSGVCKLTPPLFEVAAIRHCWDRIRPLLMKVDLKQHEMHPALTLIAPKQRYAVRPLHLLDPLDAIVYSALVRRLAPSIERARIPTAKRTVFSYRFPAQGAADFELQMQHPAFERRLKSLSERYRYVAVADIADFFANAYLHRLRNALIDASSLDGEARLIYTWLSRWSPGAASSQGIVLGPLASNVLAEALLVEVDDFLADRRLVFARYVDDYYIFCRSESSGIEALHLLAGRLMEEEHLGLNMAKSEVMRTTRLIKRLASPTARLRPKRREFVEQLLGGNTYGSVELAALPALQRKAVDLESAQEMLRQAIRAKTMNFTETGYALQVLGSLRSVSAAKLVVKNLAALAPAAQEVGRFLISIEDIDITRLREIGKDVLAFIQSDTFKTAFQSIWLLEPFTRASRWSEGTADSALIRIASSDRSPLVQRQALLALALSPKRASRLEVKSARSHSSPWVRRASLLGLRSLPRDEREHSFPRFKEWTLENALDQATVEYATLLVAAPSSPQP
ncbi:MAG TPA: RNA-directed DNA polymerase [Candidatus Limnocylindria bacterium]|jgi:hypothetical protein|nr:RNA-directed DNA polymerase [Candidatus Limnocylindria bacterium]